MGGAQETLYLPPQSLVSAAAAAAAAGGRVPSISAAGSQTMLAPYGLLQNQQSPFPSTPGSTFSDEQRLSISNSMSSRPSLSTQPQGGLGVQESTLSSPQEMNQYPGGFWSQNTNQYAGFSSGNTRLTSGTPIPLNESLTFEACVGRNTVNLPMTSGSVPQPAFHVQAHAASYNSPSARSSTGTSSSPHQQQQQLQQPQTMPQMIVTTVTDHETLPALAQQQHHAVDPYVRRMPSGFYQQRVSQPSQPQAPQLFHHPQLPPYSRPTHQISSPPVQSEPQPPLGLGQLGRPYPPYTLPGLTGGLVPNVASTANYGLLDNFSSTLPSVFNTGVAPNLSHLYGHRSSNSAHHSPEVQHHQVGGMVHAVPQDRPFKCDLCPQSFNRNHDLKRHKRIHLAVKPFPCKYCDKGFSRKDALKRHTLVKGCGKAAASSDEKAHATKASTPASRSPSSTRSLPRTAEQTPKTANSHDLSPLNPPAEL
ncbi:hypothetical protein KEM54_000031 [Ascosphaera aggregata]|nr:hypothetical protein KEM54_000031 [Ascosphaera aggregata]